MQKDEDYDRVCEECHQQVVWSEWRVDHAARESEMRTGHCGCAGKGFLQFRPAAQEKRPGVTRPRG